ncbi:MAG TPA: DUF6585 family protein [Pyrinomonadaceae bacterium]
MRGFAIPLLGLGPLVLFLVAIITVVGDYSNGRRPEGFIFVCSGGLLLLIVLFTSLIVSDGRKWSRTRSARFSVYQNGFVYEQDGKSSACRWDQIKDVNYTRVRVPSKASPNLHVNLVRSVIRNDGTVISLAETLNRNKVTAIINAAYRKR